MIDSITRITLNLQQDSTPVTVAVKRGDTGRMIKILLSDGGFGYDIADGCYAVLTATKPDGNILYNHCDIEGNEIIYEITEQTTAAAGRMTAEIKLYGKDDKLVTSAKFRIIVSGTVYSDDKVESKDEVSALTYLISETIGCRDVAREAADAAEKAVSDATAAIADAEKATEDARTAAEIANRAADRANDASVLAEQADAKVEKLREVVSKFHSNIQETVRGEVITVSDASDLPLAGLKVFGKTVQNGTPTQETPVPLESVGDGGSVGVTVAGKNLFNIENVLVEFITIGGEPYGIANAVREFYRYPFEENTQYTISAYVRNMNTNGNGHFRVYYTDGTYDPGVLRNTATEHAYRTFTSAAGKTIDYIGTYYGDGGAMVIKDGELQIEKGTVATEYEPYKDGGTLTLQKPENVPVFLPGIPVTSGGNYTDESGQQWICDEVDFEKGVYVQRVGGVDIGALTWEMASAGLRTYSLTNHYINPGHPSYILNSHYTPVTSGSGNDWLTYPDHSIGYRNDGWLYVKDATYTDAETFKTAMSGVMLYYRLNTFIEHDLSAEELAQYAALHTNYPNTTIFNDGGADMEVKYVADTKLYIDKKFAELSVALLNN